MQVAELNRRDFTKLAAAALGGMVAGARRARAEDEIGRASCRERV